MRRSSRVSRRERRHPRAASGLALAKVVRAATTGDRVREALAVTSVARAVTSVVRAAVLAVLAARTVRRASS